MQTKNWESERKSERLPVLLSHDRAVRALAPPVDRTRPAPAAPGVNMHVIALLGDGTHLQTFTAKIIDNIPYAKIKMTVCLQSSLAVSNPGTNTIGKLQWSQIITPTL